MWPGIIQQYLFLSEAEDDLSGNGYESELGYDEVREGAGDARVKDIENVPVGSNRNGCYAV